MSDPLPPPFTTPDIDVRDLDGFMMNAERLLASELVALSTGDEFKAAVRLWCRAWKQMPAASLPNDDRVLASFAGLPVKAWLKVKVMALRGFVLCEDGRLYHRVLCEDARRAFEKKTSHRLRAQAGADARWEKSRGNAQALHKHEPSSAKPIRNDAQGQGQGQGQEISTSPPPPPVVSPREPEGTATGDGGAKAVPMENLIRPEEAKPVEKPLSRKAQGMNAAALRLAITSGNVLAVLQVFGCPVEGDLALEWRRDTDGLAIGEIAAVLAWRKSTLREPVRMPSGFRAALATWRELKIDTRRHLAAVNLGALGVEHGIVEPQTGDLP